MIEYTTDRGALLFDLPTAVGSAGIRLHSGCLAKATSGPEGFKYRGRHYVGVVHLGNTDHLSTPREDYAPDPRYRFWLKKENSEAGVDYKVYYTIGEAIAEALRNYLEANPVLLGALAEAEALYAAGNLASEIEKAGENLAAMRKEYTRLMELAYPPLPPGVKRTNR